MVKSFRFLTLSSAIGLALVGVGLQSSMVAHATEAAGVVDASARETYIITFVEDGLVNFKGGVAGMKATAPAAAGKRKLDVHSVEAVNYESFLSNQRAQYISAIEGRIGRSLAVTHSYSVTLNGIAADISADDAARIRGLVGIKSVEPAGVEHLVTYRGPTFIGADKIWNGTATPDHVGTKGEGIIVGDLDGGINSDHPSFANDPACGFDSSHPKLKAVDCSSSAGGQCTGSNPEANPGFGHGVHTASTAAGNTIDNTATPAPALPDGVTMSGVAPCATLYHYKVCATDSCSGAWILAGIQNAIADQVDVVNFSISGGTSPWSGSDNDRNFLDAVNADVFVSAAAGNNSATDPTVIGRVNHRGPWVMTVAAATQDEQIGPTLSITGPGTPPANVTGISMTPGSTTPAATALTGSPVKSYTTNIEACTASGGIPSGTFTGAIALVSRGTCPFAEKITNAYGAGAVAVVVANNAPGAISMDTTGAPAVQSFSIGQADGQALYDFLGAHGESGTGDLAPIGVGMTQGDVLADFSYRGPTPGTLADETKPDIAAPGVNIYAALDDQDGNYGFMSGTSMATPHVTGAAALMRAVHPDWTVTEVKSAMMTTATNADGVKEDGVTPWKIDDVGSGRVDLSKAALAGLTLDETYAHFLAANPSGGSINVKALNLPALRNLGCTPNCTWTRTVKNQLDSAGTWNVTFDAPATVGSGFVMSATPAHFTLAPGATQDITFTATPNGTVTAIAFGNAIFTEAAAKSPDQHFTIAIKGTGTPPVVPCSAADEIFCDGFDDGSANGAGFSENWDSYAAGNVSGQGGWKGWGDDASAGANVDGTFSVSAPNSINITGASDLIHEFSGYNSGVYTITAKVYVPASFSGESYFIFENVYSDTDDSVISWSTQVKFDSATGTLANEDDAADPGSMPYVTDQWADIKLVVDLDNDTQTFSYNGAELYSGSWTQQFPGQSVPGIANIGSIDLFANGASPVYYDDIKIVRN